MKDNKNCQIRITRRESDGITDTVFEFDDYRIAVAVENILHNVNYMTGHVQYIKVGDNDENDKM